MEPEVAQDTGTPAITEDPFKQIKGEYNRKIGSLSDQIAELKKTTEAVVQHISAQAPKHMPPQKEEDLSQLMYSDPARYTSIIEERARTAALKTMESQNAAMAKQNAVLAELADEFPELGQRGSDLQKRAVEIYNTLSDEEKRLPASYKLAVKDAALELGVKPKSKRSPEEFMEPSHGFSRPRKPSNKLTPAAEEFARLIGVNVHDEAVKERLIKRSQRNWSSPSTPISTKKRK